MCLFRWVRNKIKAKRNGKIIYDYLISTPLKVVPHDGRIFLVQEDYNKDTEYYRKLVVPYHKAIGIYENSKTIDKKASDINEIKDYMTSEYLNNNL